MKILRNLVMDFGMGPVSHPPLGMVLQEIHAPTRGWAARQVPVTAELQSARGMYHTAPSLISVHHEPGHPSHIPSSRMSSLKRGLSRGFPLFLYRGGVPHTLITHPENVSNSNSVSIRRLICNSIIDKLITNPVSTTVLYRRLKC